MGLLLPLVLLTAAPAFQGSAPPADVEDRQLRGTSKALDSYLEARSDRSSTTKSRDRLRVTVDELESGLGVETLLARPDLLGRIWRLATPLEKTRAKRGKLTLSTATVAGFDEPGLRFAVQLPKRYRPRDGSYPLIILVPSVRVMPDAAITRFFEQHGELSKEDAAYRDGAIVFCPELPSDGNAWASVTHEGKPGGIRSVLAALRVAEQRFAVDADRVHLVGLGEGAALALAVGNHRADRFAGIVADVGERDLLDGRPGAANFRTLPTYFTSPSTAALEFVGAVTREGYDNGWTSNSWTAGGPWQWMRAHPRDPAPAGVTVKPGISFPTRVHWIKIDSNSRDTEARASIDRAAGKITIEARGASSVTLLLNDSLVDLDRALEVVLNGEKKRLSAHRDWTVTLDMMADATSDPGRVYVTELTVPVPPAK